MRMYLPFIWSKMLSTPSCMLRGTYPFFTSPLPGVWQYCFTIHVAGRSGDDGDGAWDRGTPSRGRHHHPRRGLAPRQVFYFFYFPRNFFLFFFIFTSFSVSRNLAYIRVDFVHNLKIFKCLYNLLKKNQVFIFYISRRP